MFSLPEAMPFLFVSKRRQETRCKLRLLQCRCRDGDHVVIATQLKGQGEYSLTDSAEILAAAVCDHYRLNPRHLILIRHYPRQLGPGLRADLFDRVMFGAVEIGPPTNFAKPSFKIMSDYDWRELRLIA